MGISNQLAKLGRQVSVEHAATDGALLSGVLGALALGSLYYNAEIWHQDYPPDVREKAGPMSAAAKRQRAVVAVPLILTALGVPVYSNLKLKRRNRGELSFLSAFVNAYAVGQMWNLFDLLVLDYLLFKLRPDFAVLPGTEGMAAYDDFSFSVRGFLKGLWLGSIPSMATAWLTSRKRNR
jgi:hypothetical protein